MAYADNHGGGYSSQGNNDFVVSIAASARVDFKSPNSVENKVSPHLIHTISVSQPVQSWTIIRDHVDFVAIYNALSADIHDLPRCPQLPAFDTSRGSQDVENIIEFRGAAQDWLNSILLYPGARESPVMRQFLSYGANITPPQFVGVSWVNFGAGPTVMSPQGNHTGEASGGISTDEAPHYSDEMEMDDMFGFEDGDSKGGHEEDSDDDTDADYYSASNRYQPTEEVLTQAEVMEIQQEAREVEMIEDVGSLAQSLGASHLGRSLQLQAEIANMKHRQTQHQFHPQAQQGVTLMAPVAPNVGSGGGGIGGAMENAEENVEAQPYISGVGDSFYQKSPVSAPRLDSFKMIKVIGKGSFGKVFLVKEKQTNEMYALKVLKKDNIIKRNQVEHTRTERNVLGYVNHPFIVGLKMAFQSKEKLYFVLDYCAGGELFFHLGKVGKFTEHRACFYAAEITLAITYVHGMDIVYRDLKPENVLLDSMGHVRLTDFGLSKEGISSSSSGANSFCGTPEYLAPEILNRQGHGRGVDWWSLGALLYEMLTGLPPFYCREREKLFEKIRKGNLDYPRYLSEYAQVLLRGLLTKDPKRRLGSGPDDANEIKSQLFFKDIEWERLMKGEIPPPWDPQINGCLDTSQFDNEFTNMPINSPGTFQGHGFNAPPADNVFEGFTFTDRAFYAPAPTTHRT